jgi:hypothetical protein
MIRISIPFLLAATVLFAQPITFKPGATIYIDKMPHDLDAFIRAEFVKQKVPVSVVLEAELADYVMTGTGTEEQGRRWHQGWLTAEQDRTSGALMVIERESKKMIWAGEAGDRSLWWGSMARGGQRKVASRLVSRFKKDLKRR